MAYVVDYHDPDWPRRVHGPDPVQLATLAERLSAGDLQIAVARLPLSEGPAVFAQVAAGRAGGKSSCSFLSSP